MKKLVIIALATLTAAAPIASQGVASLPPNTKSKNSQPKAALPKVIIMGDSNQPQFESALEGSYQKLLLTACGNDVAKASTAWNQFSLDMEKFAAAEAFDLDGMKVWIYVLFSSTGRMDHVAYYLKPGSRFVKPEVFEPFLEKFMAQHQFGVTAEFNFSQYGSLVFPTPK